MPGGRTARHPRKRPHDFAGEARRGSKRLQWAGWPMLGGRSVRADTVARVRSIANVLRGLSPWGRLVAASGVLVIGSLVTIGVWALLTTQREISTYSVRGSLNGISLDLGEG